MNHEKNESRNAFKKCFVKHHAARIRAVKSLLKNNDLSTWARDYWSRVLEQIQ
jgi:hypothetical protein